MNKKNYLKLNIKKLKRKLRSLLIEFAGRGISIFSYIFPLFEISYYFGAKVFLSTDNPVLHALYQETLSGVNLFYGDNSYLMFFIMIGIFMACSRGTLKLTRYVRFNVIQAILLSVICSCVGSIFALLPLWIRESALGLMMANGFFLGILVLTIYASLLILNGLYPSIPVISEAARLQVFRGYLNDD